MKFEEHCAESVRLFGKSYEEIHLWLDEFAGTDKYKSRHRRVRHHEAGIREAVKLFGQEAEPAIRQHIISDLKLEGWTENDLFPQNEAQYVRLGLW